MHAQGLDSDPSSAEHVTAGSAEPTSKPNEISCDIPQAALHVLKKYVRIARRQPTFFGNLTPEEKNQRLLFVHPKLPAMQRFYILLLSLLQAPSLSMNVTIIDETLLIGRALIGMCLNDLTLATSFSSSSLPLLNILDSIPVDTAGTIITLLRHVSPLHQVRFWHSKAREDLNIAKGLCQICIATKVNNDTPVDESYMCMLLLDEYAITMDYETITQAIAHGRASLHGVYGDDPKHLSQLAVALGQRYLHYNTPEDVDNSIALLHTAIAAAEKRQWSASKVLTLRLKLNIALSQKLTLTPRSTEDGVSRVGVLRQVLAHGSLDETATSLYRLLLAQALTSDSSGEYNFDEAISLYESALGLGCELNPQSVMLGKAALSECFRKRYEQAGLVEDLDRSIHIILEILEESQEVTSVYTGELKARLSETYWVRYKRLRNRDDLEASAKLSGKLTNDNAVPTEMQILLSIFSAESHADEHHYEAAIIHYRKALNLLSQYLMVGRGRRIESFIFWEALGARAAVTSAACGKSCEALEMLECGRSIEWNRGLQMRSQLDQLQVDYPDHAASFRQLSEALEGAEWTKSMANVIPSTLDQMGLDHAPWEQRFILSQRWDSMLAEIRNLPGYENFLASPEYDQLKRASKQGPVVVINVCLYGSDAFVLTHSTLDRPQIVRMSDDLFQNVIRWSNELLEGIEKVQDGRIGESQFGRRILRSILKGIWQEIVQPVRESLRCLAPYARRIWWCPVGPLTFLPLHLVTNGFDVNDECVPLIPSYTITLSSLLRARLAIDKSSREDDGLLAVCCERPRDSNHKKISGTRQEVKVLRKISAGHPLTVLDGVDATVEQVLAGMSNHSWLHLACHGVQATDEPLRSHFALSDGPLRMADIAASRLDHAEFAFLSACQTATGVLKMSDEAMHLAASFQFIGFRGIVATMWSVHDGTAKKLAKEVYSFLFRDPTTTPKVEDAAEALCRATQKLRNQGVPLSRLAPFIHIGV